MSNRLKATLFIVLALLTASLSASSAKAQGLPGINDPLTISTIPNNPRPNERVSIHVQSFSVDLDRALVVWTLDGKEQAKGVGLKDFVLQAGPSGTLKTVGITVTLIGIGTFSQTVNIRPAGVMLVWESDSYAPPFYKGKALHPFGGAFTVIALPEFITTAGKRLDPHDLIYTWKKNGEVVAEASGYGKTRFTTSQTSYLKQGEDISVDVSAPRDNIVATGDITVAPTVPKVLLYENSPLYGTIFEKALIGTTLLTNEEVSYSAEPYFFSVKQKADPSLSYAWTLNGGNLSEFQNKPNVTLRKEAGTKGLANLGLTMQSSIKLLQGSSRSLDIKYE